VHELFTGEELAKARLRHKKRTAIVSSVMPGAPPKPTDSVEPFALSIIAVGYIG
jgi:hypothetical protein